MAEQLSPLVATSWLADHLDDDDLRIIDACWKFRDELGQGTAYDDDEDFIREHIPGAVYVGMVSDLSDRQNPIPDMISGPEEFAKTMSRLGVTNDSHVVVYDGSGLPLAAARLWWALSYYGHDKVQVLDGGLQQWKLEQRPLARWRSQAKVSNFQVRPRPEWIARKSDVRAALDNPTIALIDCLPDKLFRGEGKHIWGARSGHIPGAVNIPAISNLDPELALTSY